jgi:hypothetical protein
MDFVIKGSSGGYITHLRREGAGIRAHYKWKHTPDLLEAEGWHTLEEAHRLARLFSGKGSGDYDVETRAIHKAPGVSFAEPRQWHVGRWFLLVAIVVVVILVALSTRSHSAPHVWLKGDRQCPAGMSQSGGYCKPSPSSQQECIPKGREQCPGGWRQTGGFCCLP